MREKERYVIKGRDRKWEKEGKRKRGWLETEERNRQEREKKSKRGKIRKEEQRKGGGGGVDFCIQNCSMWEKIFLHRILAFIVSNKIILDLEQIYLLLNPFNSEAMSNAQ